MDKPMQEMTTKVNLPVIDDMKSKILLIEKDKPIINSFKKAMIDNGIKVDHCINSIQVNRKLECLEDYEVILVDIEFKDQLEKMLSITDKPFYVMWTNDYECSPEIENCLNLGASLYLKKDEDMNKLVSLVKKVKEAYISNYLN